MSIVISNNVCTCAGVEASLTATPTRTSNPLFDKMLPLGAKST